MKVCSKFISFYNVPKLRYGPLTLNIKTCATGHQTRCFLRKNIVTVSFFQNCAKHVYS